ncbi:hypothetical protein [Oerskovia turbata]
MSAPVTTGVDAPVAGLGATQEPDTGLVADPATRPDAGVATEASAPQRTDDRAPAAQASGDRTFDDTASGDTAAPDEATGALIAAPAVRDEPAPPAEQPSDPPPLPGAGPAGAPQPPSQSLQWPAVVALTAALAFAGLVAAGLFDPMIEAL